MKSFFLNMLIHIFYCYKFLIFFIALRILGLFFPIIFLSVGDNSLSPFMV